MCFEYFLKIQQEDLKLSWHLLPVYLKENNPAATDIEKPQLTTRILEAGRRMQANFKLTYTVPADNTSTNKISREGYFILTSENGQDWTAKMERIDDSFVQFSDADALAISLQDAKDAAKEEAAAEAEAQKAAPAEPAH